VRAVIRYEWARGVSGTEIHNRLVEEAVQRFFHMQSPDFFLEGFLKLIKRYDKCLNVLGTYVEK